MLKIEKQINRETKPITSPPCVGGFSSTTDVNYGYNSPFYSCWKKSCQKVFLQNGKLKGHQFKLKTLCEILSIWLLELWRGISFERPRLLISEFQNSVIYSLESKVKEIIQIRSVILSKVLKVYTVKWIIHTCVCVLFLFVCLVGNLAWEKNLVAFFMHTVSMCCKLDRYISHYKHKVSLWRSQRHFLQRLRPESDVLFTSLLKYTIRLFLMLLTLLPGTK